jgi:CRP/FNR family transcriptional regulator
MADAAASRRETLRRVPYFAALPDDLLDELALAATERRVARGQIIFVEGEPCAGLHVVAQGQVRVYKLSPQGREQVLQQIGPSETFNEVAVWDGGANPASAMAATDAAILVLQRAAVHRLALERPEFAWALLESIAQRTRHLVLVVEDLALRSVKARVARLLLAEAERTEERDALRRDQMITQAEMAARLGTVREMIGRALRDLADAGLIEFDRHRIVIVDRAGLVEISEG